MVTLSPTDSLNLVLFDDDDDDNNNNNGYNNDNDNGMYFDRVTISVVKAAINIGFCKKKKLKKKHWYKFVLKIVALL